MKQLALVSLVSVALFGALAIPAFSQTSDTVEVSVSPAVQIAVSIDESAVDFGTVALSASDSSRTLSNPSQVLTAFNLGNVPVDLLIAGSHALPTSGQQWTLSCNPGTVGFDQYILRFWLAAMSQSSAVALCTTDQTLASDVLPGNGAGQGVGFQLRLTMPTGTSVFGPHSSTVTITAIQ